MKDALTILVKYIFLDIVGYSRNRTAEAQSDIIFSLNNIVKESIKNYAIQDENLILLPTGDGLAICILHQENPYDLHVLLALEILKLLELYNAKTQEEQRKFTIRIGINSNVDNIVTDIRGNKNLAGAGINFAQRLMSTGDGNQIIVGQSVYDILSNREKYQGLFREFSAKIKHNIILNCFQLVDKSKVGLNTDLPSCLLEPKNKKYPSFIAHYIGSAIHCENFLISQNPVGSGRYAGSLLLYFITLDLLDKKFGHSISRRNRISSFQAKTLAELFTYFENQDFNLTCELHLLLCKHILEPWELYFVNNGMPYSVVTKKAKTKLKRDFPKLLTANYYDLPCLK